MYIVESDEKKYRFNESEKAMKLAYSLAGIYSKALLTDEKNTYIFTLSNGKIKIKKVNK